MNLYIYIAWCHILLFLFYTGAFTHEVIKPGTSSSTLLLSSWISKSTVLQRALSHTDSTLQQIQLSWSLVLLKINTKKKNTEKGVDQLPLGQQLHFLVTDSDPSLLEVVSEAKYWKKTQVTPSNLRKGLYLYPTKVHATFLHHLLTSSPVLLRLHVWTNLQP